MTERLERTLYVQWFFVAQKEKPNTRLGFLFCRRRNVKTLKGDTYCFTAILQWGTLSSDTIADKTEPWRCFPFSFQHLLHPKISGGGESKMQTVFKKTFFLKPTAPWKHEVSVAQRVWTEFGELRRRQWPMSNTFQNKTHPRPVQNSFKALGMTEHTYFMNWLENNPSSS